MNDEKRTEKNIFLSIIIPVYNAMPYLAECLDSVLKGIEPVAASPGRDTDAKDVGACADAADPKGAGFEIILVDDGSTDEGAALCDEYASKFGGIIVIHKENGGLVSARKAGVKAASGEYVAFVDADDSVNEGYFLQIKQELEKSGYPDALLTGFSMQMCPDGEYIRQEFEFPAGTLPAGTPPTETFPTEIQHAPVYEAPGTQNIIRAMLSDKSFNTHIPSAIWTKFIKRGLFDKYMSRVYDDVSLGEDALFSLSVLSRASSAALAPHLAGYRYRYVESSMARDKGQSRLSARITFAENLMAITKEEPEFSENARIMCMSFIYAQIREIIGSAAVRPWTWKYRKAELNDLRHKSLALSKMIEEYPIYELEIVDADKELIKLFRDESFTKLLLIWPVLKHIRKNQRSKDSNN